MIAQVTRYSLLTQVGPESCAFPWPKLLSHPCATRTLSQVGPESSRGAGLRLWHSWPTGTVQDPGKTWLTPGSLLAAWRERQSLGSIAAAPCLPPLAVAPASLAPWLKVIKGSRLTFLWYSIWCDPLFCEGVGGSLWGVRAFPRERSFVFLCFSGVSVVWVPMSHEPPQIVLRAFTPGPYTEDHVCSPCLRAQPPLTAGGHEHLSCFSADNCSLHEFCGNFFFLLVMLPSEISKVPHWPKLWEDFLLCGHFSSFMTPSPEWVSVRKSFISPSVFYLLSYILSKGLGCRSGCLVSSANVQKLICRSCSTFRWSFDVLVGEKVVSPSYSSTIFPPVYF